MHQIGYLLRELATLEKALAQVREVEKLVLARAVQHGLRCEPHSNMGEGDSVTNEPHPRPRSEPERADRTIVYWEEMAAWWDERQGDEGGLWHRTLIDPTLFRVTRPRGGAARAGLGVRQWLHRTKAREVWGPIMGVEASTPIMGHARAREEREPLGIVYHVVDAARLDGLGDAGFDVVVCNMALMDVPDAKAALQEAACVLRPRGRLIASLSHPCFAISVSSSGWVVERMGFETTVFRKVSRYRRVFEHLDTLARGGGSAMAAAAYHRPLSWYSRALRSAGFDVSAFEEPEPTEEFMAEDPEGAWIAQISLQCVIEAYKFKP